MGNVQIHSGAIFKSVNKATRYTFEPGYILAKSSDSLLVKVEGSDAVLLENLNIDLAIVGDYL